MEVHHHSHTTRKKWTHYFWEFFMLFLAVTLGFFVENKREHIIEHRREKDYIKQLIEDLKYDTSFFSLLITTNSTNQSRMDSMGFLLRNYQPESATEDIYYLGRSIPSMGISPQYNNRTFEQLKNSGMLRLVRDPAVLDSITMYYESLKDLDVRNIHRLERLNNLFIAGEDLFEGEAFNAIADSGFKKPLRSPSLLKEDKMTISRYVMRLGFYRITDRIILDKIKSIHRPAAVSLITLLKTKYHLD